MTDTTVWTRMDRSQTKCLLASSAGHFLLFGLLALGTAFLNRKPESDDLPKLKFIPSKLVDQMLAGGGGNPKLPTTDAEAAAPTGPEVSTTPPEALAPTPPVASTPAPPPTPPPPPQSKPAEVTPPPPEPPAIEKAEPTPPPKPKQTTKKVDLKATPKPDKSKTTPPPEPEKQVVESPKTPPKKPQTDIDLSNVVVRKNDDLRKKAQAREAAERKAQEEAQKRAQEEAYANAVAAAEKRQAALQSSLRTLGTGFSTDKGVAIEVGGPGGFAYANYAAYVKKAYDTAWLVSPSLGDSDTTAEVAVTVLKTGEILNAHIVRRSGMAGLDKSVETALARVRRLPPFPEGAREEQRTFNIRFNLKAKRSAG